MEDNNSTKLYKFPEFKFYDALSERVLYKDELWSYLYTVFIFLSNRKACKQDRYILDHLLSFTDDYIARQVSFVAVNPNDQEQDSQESFESMRDEAQIMEFPFPYLFDPGQEFAELWEVDHTPEFFVFDTNGYCLYRGAYDDAAPDNGKNVTGRYLGEVLEALLEGNDVPFSNTPVTGCPVLRKKGG